MIYVYFLSPLNPHIRRFFIILDHSYWDLEDEDTISELSIEWQRANTLGSAHLPVERRAVAARDPGWVVW